MYSIETRHGDNVQVTDATETGRILVVDDDRVFGGFLLAALGSRGHEVEWAGSISDALTSLYARRYDLAIIDLRLPDGSGLTFLREATDEGLFAGTSAIILTGHDFEEPDDIHVFHKPLDLDPFLDRMSTIVAFAKRRLRRAAGGSGNGRPVVAHDGRRRPFTEPKLELVLYTSAASEKSRRAVRAIQEVLERYDRSQISFTICDLSGDPEKGDADAVVFTPTLVKRGPGPRTWIVGNLDQPDLLIDLIDVSGVNRKRDG